MDTKKRIEDLAKFFELAKAGSRIQIQQPDGTWADVESPLFNFATNKYRVEDQPLITRWRPYTFHEFLNDYNHKKPLYITFFSGKELLVSVNETGITTKQEVKKGKKKETVYNTHTFKELLSFGSSSDCEIFGVLDHYIENWFEV